MPPDYGVGIFGKMDRPRQRSRVEQAEIRCSVKMSVHQKWEDVPVLTAIVESCVGWAVGRVGDKAAGAFMRKWSERQAKAELVKIIVETIDAATVVAPNLEEDFRSETFVHHVVAPVVVQFLRDLNIEKPEAEIAQSYIERFVEPFLRGRTADQTLPQLFRTQRSDLEHGISAFLTRLRPALYSSDH